MKGIPFTGDIREKLDLPYFHLINLKTLLGMPFLANTYLSLVLLSKLLTSCLLNLILV